MRKAVKISDGIYKAMEQTLPPIRSKGGSLASRKYRRSGLRRGINTAQHHSRSRPGLRARISAPCKTAQRAAPALWSIAEKRRDQKHSPAQSQGAPPARRDRALQHHVSFRESKTTAGHPAVGNSCATRRVNDPFFLVIAASPLPSGCEQAHRARQQLPSLGLAVRGPVPKRPMYDLLRAVLRESSWPKP